MRSKIGKYITLKQEREMYQGSGVDGWNIKETHTFDPFEAVIVSENVEVCKIQGIREKHTFDISIDFINHEKKIMRVLQPNNTITQITDGIKLLMKAVKDRNPVKTLIELTPKIYDENDNVVGVFDGKIIKDKEGNDVSAIIFDYYDKKYIIYKAPADIKRFSYVVYDGDKLVAEIINDRRKGFTTNQDLLKFDIYVEDENYFNVACLLTLFWTRLAPEEGRNSNTNKLKEYARFFNQEFIDNIRKNTNPEYYPENMELAKELDKKARRYGPRMIIRILWLILMIPVFIIIILLILGKI